MYDKEKIRRIVLFLGADVCGFACVDYFEMAEKGFLPSDVYEDCKSVVVFGVALPVGLYKVSSRLVYGHFNCKCCDYVNKIAFDASRILEESLDCTCVPIPCDGPYDCWDEKTKTGKGLISMKYAAKMAGLGCIGKNTLLLNEKYGNRLVIGAVLTDLPLESDESAPDLCLDGCNRCINSCPAGAIEKNSVNQKKCRENTYSTNSRGFETVECNICRRVCPMRFGRKKTDNAK